MTVPPASEAPVRCAVIGLGPVGLSLTALLAALDRPVWAAEQNPERLAKLLAGETPFHEPGLRETLGRVRARIEYVAGAQDFPDDVSWVFLCVGTPGLPDGQVDLSALDRAWAALINRPTIPRFVVLRSTLPLGAAERYAADLAERAPGSALLYQPEFLQEGQAITGVFFPDRLIIGGNTGAAGRLASLLRPVTHGTLPAPGLSCPQHWKPAPVQLVSLSEATLIKLATNAFLAMKISFANEISGLSEHFGADMAAVSAGLGLDPRVGGAFLESGLGWGGSCLGKDLGGLIHAAEHAGLPAPLLQATRAVNDARADAVIRRLERHLPGLAGRRVAVLGAAFKPGTDDVRGSPTRQLIRQLTEIGATVVLHDPLADLPAGRQAGQLWPELKFTLASSPEDAARGADALVIATACPEYRALPWAKLMSSMRAPMIVDTRRVLAEQLLPGVTEVLGRPLASVTERCETQAATLAE